MREKQTCAYLIVDDMVSNDPKEEVKIISTVQKKFYKILKLYLKLESGTSN